MWIRKAKHQEIVDSYTAQIEALIKENENLKSLLPRRKVLSMMKYSHLVRMAQRDYGIMPNKYEDKADLIDEIIYVEKQLGKTV
jgi:hypothetical protein